MALSGEIQVAEVAQAQAEHVVAGDPSQVPHQQQHVVHRDLHAISVRQDKSAFTLVPSHEHQKTRFETRTQTFDGEVSGLTNSRTNSMTYCLRIET